MEGLVDRPCCGKRYELSHVGHLEERWNLVKAALTSTENSIWQMLHEIHINLSFKLEHNGRVTHAVNVPLTTTYTTSVSTIDRVL